MSTLETDVSSRANASTLLTDQSVAKQLLFGQVLEENLFPYPAINERDREVLGMIVESIDRFLEGKEADFARWDREARQPDEFVQSLRELGLFGLIIPEEFGGLGLSNAAYARVLAQTSSYDSSVSLTIGAHSSIGMKGLLLFGTAEQKARYLPKLATGEMIAAFCLTEAGAGSDAAAIRTTAKRNGDGSFTLNGEKLWITNGGIADFYTVFARTDGPEGKVTAFLVEAAWPGVSHGHHEDKMGIRASSTTTVAFSDVRVPPENVLGDVGKGFKVAMGILNNGRTGLGGGAVGGMKALIRRSVAQAQERKQFDRPIAQFGLVREKIAQMTVECFAAESAVWMVAHYIDSGCGDYSVEAAITKVFASEAMQRTAYESLQIAGGNGYMRDLPYEQYTRDARILPIFEGTNEILRLYIALSSLKDVGASLKELQSAVSSIFNDPIKGFGVLSGYAERRFSRATGLGASIKVSAPVAPALRPLVDIYENYARATSREAERLLRKYGRGISERQHAQRRIADLMIDLFVGLCVISRADSIVKSDPASAADVTQIAKVFTHQARRRMVRNVRGLAHNEDDAIEALAGSIIEKGRYPWDVL
ncbi:MAG: acyl-CoA dehydrogenase family protein [Gammaproteobacteria bacterium]|nr:acyl-CoA dehydrogenase family protein [Gammaproteobacteria bacterium]MDH5175231.1 acyl-CoA dehydrogenase family protein [Gammaproteobacteria bacterium]MDH5225979.1 acyl-CoA dehydrogenase family protein [Gammaproteobacteria bacterium]